MTTIRLTIMAWICPACRVEKYTEVTAAEPTPAAIC
jgi:hypothetical protein